MADRDTVNIKREIEFEKEAIANYELDIEEATNPEVKSLFEHILQEEKEHEKELTECLRKHSESKSQVKTKEDRYEEGKDQYG